MFAVRCGSSILPMRKNPGTVAQAFGSVQMTPTTFLINKHGEIVKRFVGEPDFAALHGLIEQLLAET